MPDTAHLKYRVDPDLKRQLVQAAKDAGKSERSFVVEALAVALGRVSENQPVAAPTDPTALVVKRMMVRLPAFLWAGVVERAEAVSMAPSRWIAALVQSTLARHPVMTDAELAVIRESNQALLSLGRNLNQVARALNNAPHETERVKLAAINELRSAIEQTTSGLRALVRTSLGNWRGE